jgi:hypothetical protein
MVRDESSAPSSSGERDPHTTVDAPTAVHIGADELPFVGIGDGSKLKVIQVKEAEGLKRLPVRLRG